MAKTSKSLDQRMDECCEEAIEAGYMTEAMLIRHQINWFARWFFMFGLKRQPDQWEYWYHDTVNAVDFNWQDVIKFKMNRKTLEMRWCPVGERR